MGRDLLWPRSAGGHAHREGPRFGAGLNGQTTASDLGFGRMASTKKDYVGAVMARRPALIDPERQGFVGFRPVDRSSVLRAGAQFWRRAPRRSRKTIWAM